MRWSRKSTTFVWSSTQPWTLMAYSLYSDLKTMPATMPIILQSLSKKSAKNFIKMILWISLRDTFGLRISPDGSSIYRPSKRSESENLIELLIKARIAFVTRLNRVLIYAKRGTEELYLWVTQNMSAQRSMRRCRWLRRTWGSRWCMFCRSTLTVLWLGTVGLSLDSTQTFIQFIIIGARSKIWIWISRSRVCFYVLYFRYLIRVMPFKKILSLHWLKYKSVKAHRHRDSVN